MRSTSSVYDLFYVFALIKMGLKPENLAAIGKCYSTDPKAVLEMKKIGIDVCDSSQAFDSHRSFDEQYRHNIKKFILKRLRKLKDSKFNKIIVLDDGGVLIDVINSLPLPKAQKSKIIGIEQTSSGYQKLIGKNVNFPIINVARSPAKLNYESPIIAKLVTDRLVCHIKQLPFELKKVLIIGNGAIGSEVGKRLSKTYEVHIFDNRPERSVLNKNDVEERLKGVDLIVGCTGSPALRPYQYKLLKKNVVLASASSSDIEFNSVKLRRKIRKVKDCHKDLYVNNIHLLNCGFPIDFSPNYETDVDELQLTRSLLLSAVLQAHNHFPLATKGFIDLDIENQRDILQRFFLLNRSGNMGKRDLRGSTTISLKKCE